MKKILLIVTLLMGISSTLYADLPPEPTSTEQKSQESKKDEQKPEDCKCGVDEDGECKSCEEPSK